jgi:hypothetical protein
MSLEEALAANTAAIKDLTAVIKGGQAAPAASAGKSAIAAAKTATTAGKTSAAPKVTFEEVQAKAAVVREVLGKETIVSIIKNVGGGTLKDMKPDKFAEVLAVCDSAVEDGKYSAPGDQDDDL